MNSEANSQGNTPARPLEPGRPDVMPNPPADGGQTPSKEGERPLIPDDGVSEEEGMSDVDINNSVSQENPLQR